MRRRLYIVLQIDTNPPQVQIRGTYLAREPARERRDELYAEEGGEMRYFTIHDEPLPDQKV